MSKVAVIIITFNGERWIEKCLASVLSSSVSCKIYIVDNASTDDTVFILQKFGNIEIIKSDINLGFGKANNIGIKKALQDGFKHFFLLNQDTWIEEQTIENLSNELQKNQAFGILSPIHFSSNETDLDKNFGNYYKKSIQKTNNIAEVPFVNAAAWMVSKSCFEKVGLFEPIFDHYGEDRNFCDRTKFHKLKIGIVENTKIVHDRTIYRNLKKDKIQSKYLITSTLININDTYFQRNFLALKQVFGLPKYFFKFYGCRKSVVLMLTFLLYYIKNIINFKTLQQIIKTSKAGKNGL